MPRKLTELDKLECAEYTIKLLDDALTNHGPCDGETMDWLFRAKEAVVERLKEYIGRVRFGQ